MSPPRAETYELFKKVIQRYVQDIENSRALFTDVGRDETLCNPIKLASLLISSVYRVVTCFKFDV